MPSAEGITNRYGIKNTFRPTFLVPKPYGWSSAPGYNRADIPTAWVDQPGYITQEQLAQQFAYEWLESNSVGAGYSNPPFVTGAAGRLHPSLTDASGRSARILRGYIRRAAYDGMDPVSKARLYFMYNPEYITREYVSYLDQGALDPFNTVYQSGNLVAPPSVMNFRFDLFFDRQEEAMDADHPGVFVDYQFFDLVVRNVVPQDPNQSSNTLPDNGVMMVNPRDITVVFSPQITVQGRPTNAQVVFEKFTHRMTPVRMRIALEMRVIYFGPMREMVEYKMEQVEFISEASVPVDQEMAFNVTYSDLVLAAGSTTGAVGYAPSAAGGANYAGMVGLSGDANTKARVAAYQYAASHVIEGQTRYLNDGGSGRWNLPHSADCSGLVWAGYRGINQHTNLGWPANGAPSVEGMITTWQKQNWRTGYLVAHWDPGSEVHRSDAKARILKNLQTGDLLLRYPHVAGHNSNHVVFIAGTDGDRLRILDAAYPGARPQVGHRSYTWSHVLGDFNWVVKPLPIASGMASNYMNGPR